MTDRPNILLAVVDCLRADRVGSGSDDSPMPFVSTLARQGTVFTRAYSPASWTVPAHASLLTGELPSEHGAHIGQPSLSKTPHTVFPERLSSAGYDTVGISANPWLSADFGFTRGFGDFVEVRPSLPFEDSADPRALNWQGHDTALARIRSNLSWIAKGDSVRRAFNLISFLRSDYPLAPGEQINAEVQQWLSSRDEPSPFFMLLNYMDVHEPYRKRRLEPHLDAPVQPDAFDANWNADSLLSGIDANDDDVRRVYDASTSLADAILEQLFDILRDAGELENTVVVILGDHGQALGENGFWGHGFFLYHELLHIPLIVYSEHESSNLPDVVSHEVSLSHLPNYIAEVTDTKPLAAGRGTITSVGSFDDARSDPVLAQSYGVRKHMKNELEDSGVDVPLAGSEIIYRNGWQGYYDCSTGEFSVAPVEGQSSATADTPANLKDKLTLDPCDRTVSDEPLDIDSSVEHRLKNLGYR